MGKSVTYYCDRCKTKMGDMGVTRIDITSKSLTLFNSYTKSFKEELYFCDNCLFILKDKLQTFVHRTFLMRKI